MKRWTELGVKENEIQLGIEPFQPSLRPGLFSCSSQFAGGSIRYFGTYPYNGHKDPAGYHQGSFCSYAKSSSSSMVRASDRSLEDLGSIPSWISISFFQ